MSLKCLFSNLGFQLHKYGLDPLRNSPTEGIPPLGPISIVMIIGRHKYNHHVFKTFERQNMKEEILKNITIFFCVIVHVFQITFDIKYF